MVMIIFWVQNFDISTVTYIFNNIKNISPHHRLWGPPSLLSNGYQVLFPRC